MDRHDASASSDGAVRSAPRTADDQTRAPSILRRELVLPCGAVLGNRLAKAAMSEQLATRGNDPSKALIELYGRWARSGAGLLITGNVMVARDAVSEPRQVVLDGRSSMRAVVAWAAAARSGGAQAWVQLNHGGRQIPRALNRHPLSPSAVAVHGPRGFFGMPREMTADDIALVIHQFRQAAVRATEAGFSGVQIHAAHGYLLSQFLSPAVNRRTDDWGGDPVRRHRLLGEVLRAVRGAIGPEVPLAVKLNSSDFARHGIHERDAAETAVWLGELGVDLLEISGGTFETTAMAGTAPQQAGRRAGREPYFAEFASAVRRRSSVPIMLTGGFRTSAAMAHGVGSGDVDLVGLARPLVWSPVLPMTLLAASGSATAGDTSRLPRWALRSSMLAGLTEVAWHTEQLRRLARGRDPKLGEGHGRALARYAARQAVHMAQARASRPTPTTQPTPAPTTTRGEV